MASIARPVADENDISAPKLTKLGLGLNGVKDSAKHAFGRTLSKPVLAPGKTSVSTQQRVRTVLGDLTNSTKPTPAPASAAVPGKARAAPVNTPVEAVEKIAGKSWAAFEEELKQKEDTALEERLKRVAAGASRWTTSYLSVRDDDVSSDSDSNSESLSERFEEAPIIVQLLAPRVAGVRSSLRVSRAADLLPDVPDISLNFEFCWSDDDPSCV